VKHDELGRDVVAVIDSVDRSLSSRMNLATRGLIVAQIIAVVVLAATTAVRFQLWSPSDEGAHFENVIYVAQHGSYPILGKTLAGEQELAIAQGVYPAHTTIDPRKFGLGGLAYEAFQPPLYYYLAAPVTFLSGNYHTKAIFLRFFGMLLLLISIGLLARLSQHVLKERWLLGLAGGLVVFLLPNSIVRMVNISNGNLALPLAILTVTEMWIAWERGSSRRLVLCGVLVGFGLLTELFLAALLPVLILVAFSVLRKTRTRRDVAHVVGGGVIAGLMVLPWLIFNEVTYHAVTANGLAKQEQLSIINPTHARFTIGHIPGTTVLKMFQPLWPTKWVHILTGHTFLDYLATIFQIAFVPTALVVTLLLGRRLLTSGLWILLGPWVALVVMCGCAEIIIQWPTIHNRYALPFLAVFGLFEVAAMLAVSRTIRPLLISLAAMSVFLVVLWVHVVPTTKFL
jgi:4-amino-4-deoxy-L-arabinose transferase-like glycosyltransferase